MIASTPATISEPHSTSEVTSGKLCDRFLSQSIGTLVCKVTRFDEEASSQSRGRFRCEKVHEVIASVHGSCGCRNLKLSHTIGWLHSP
jgi:hypothetical protein